MAPFTNKKDGKKWQTESGDELRHRDKLMRLEQEVRSTFVDGEYIHLRNRSDFEWQYVEYLRPHRFAP